MRKKHSKIESGNNVVVCDYGLIGRAKKHKATRKTQNRTVRRN